MFKRFNTFNGFKRLGVFSNIYHLRFKKTSCLRAFVPSCQKNFRAFVFQLPSLFGDRAGDAGNKQQTTNNKQQTTNNKQQTTNTKHQTPNLYLQPLKLHNRFCCRIYMQFFVNFFYVAVYGMITNITFNSDLLITHSFGKKLQYIELFF